jgi:hypothetical protein
MLDSLAIVFDCRRVHSRDVLFQRLTLDKSHGIAETAVRRFSKPVNWHDAWMIQPRGNYGFELKLLTAIAAVAMFRPDEFQNDIALKFAVVGNVYLAQSRPSSRETSVSYTPAESRVPRRQNSSDLRAQ